MLLRWQEIEGPERYIGSGNGGLEQGRELAGQAHSASPTELPTVVFEMAEQAGARVNDLDGQRELTELLRDRQRFQREVGERQRRALGREEERQHHRRRAGLQRERYIGKRCVSVARRDRKSVV